MTTRAQRSVDGYGRAYRLLAGYALWLAAVQVGTIAVSVTHIGVTRASAIAVILVAAIAAQQTVRRLLPPEPRPERAAWGFLKGLSAAVIAFAAFITIVSWIAALTKPDLSWDGNSYHIPMIHLWAQKGYVHWIAPEDPGAGWSWILMWLFNSYPKGVETIGYVMTMAVGSSHPVNAQNLFYIPVGVLGITVAARRLGASPYASITAAAAFVFIPVVVAQGMTAYVDAGLACGVAGLVGALAETRARLSPSRAPWATAPALAACIGLAATSKSSGIAPSLLAMGVLGLAALDMVRRAPRTGRGPLVKRYATFLLLVAGLAACVAGYWYGRAWIHTGNPLSPVRVSVLGKTIFDGVPLADAVTEDSLTPEALRPLSKPMRAFYTWTQGGVTAHPYLTPKWKGWPLSIRYYDSQEGGLGFLWLLACIPSLAYVAGRYVGERTWRRPGASLGLLPYILVVIGVSFMATPMNWWARYTISLYALGLPCLALALDGIAKTPLRHPATLLRPWMVACFALLAVESLITFRYCGLQPGFLAIERKISYKPRDLVRELTTYDRAYFYGNFSRLDHEVIASDDGVGLGPMTVGSGPLAGVLSMPIGRRRMVFISPSAARDPARLRRIIDDNKLRWIFWTDQELTPQPLVDAAQRSDRTIGYWRTFDVAPPGSPPIDPAVRTLPPK